MTPSVSRAMPNADDAERGLLGAIFVNSRVIDDVYAIVSEKDFWREPHAILYRAALDLHQRGQFVDMPILFEELKKTGSLEEGGAFRESGYEQIIIELFDHEPSASNAVYYATLIREASVRRRLVISCESLASRGYDRGIDFTALLNEAEELITSVSDVGRVDNSESIADVLVTAMAAIEANLKGLDTSSVATGFVDLDEMTGGLRPGELVILAGRPSMGKSALATNIAERIALAGAPVLFVSLEMSTLEISQRILFSRARIPFHRSRGCRLTSDEVRKLIEAQALFQKCPLTLDDSPSASVGLIASLARRLGRKKKLALIVVDYLQLIDPDNSRDHRQEQVAKISRRLKSLARELKVPVLCLAQLNRQAEVTKDNRPRLSHLRESGAIEQDADLVLLCHRDEYFETDPARKLAVAGVADIIVAKHRNGPTGCVKLAWISEYMRFENLAKDEWGTKNVRGGNAFDPDKWHR